MRLFQILVCVISFSIRLGGISNNNIFFNAIFNHDYVVIQEFLTQGLDPNIYTYKQHKTPLHIASYQGDLKTVRLLLEYGADVNVKMDENYTPLHLASQGGYLEVVKLLLEFGAYTEIRNKDHFTALHLASLNGYYDVVKYFIEQGMFVDIEGKDKSTALQLAAQNDHSDIVKYLVEKGANVNHLAIERGSPLHFAVHGNSLESVKILLANGASVNIMNESQATPFVWNGYIGNVEIAKSLIAAGANTSLSTNRHYTALHTASIRGNTQLVKFLLEKHIYTGKELSTIGLLAINYAAFYGHQVTLEEMVKWDHHFLNMRNLSGRTALFYAIENKQVETVKFLYSDLHADKEIKDYSGQGALDYASKLNFTNIIHILE